MAFRGNLLRLTVHGETDFVYTATPQLTHEIEMKRIDGSLRGEALIQVPMYTKTRGGRVGVIFGNHNLDEPQVNFELHAKGQVRLYWNSGQVDITGRTDLRDGKEHVVAFERSRTGTKVLVDGKVEAEGAAGSDIPPRLNGTWIGHDWREGGMAFRGNLLRLTVHGETDFQWSYEGGCQEHCECSRCSEHREHCRSR